MPYDNIISRGKVKPLVKEQVSGILLPKAKTKVRGKPAVRVRKTGR